MERERLRVAAQSGRSGCRAENGSCGEKQAARRELSCRVYLNWISKGETMAGSKIPGPSSTQPLLACLPPRTPGSLGINDAADPNADALRGDSPGSLGINDGAASVCQVADSSQLPGSDQTCWLPVPNPNAPRLTDQDFQTAANEYGIEVAVIHAVAKVESGGRTGFDSQGRPKILFEAHIFHKFTKGKY